MVPSGATRNNSSKPSEARHSGSSYVRGTRTERGSIGICGLAYGPTSTEAVYCASAGGTELTSSTICVEEDDEGDGIGSRDSKGDGEESRDGLSSSQ
jgi:hypothetical protein